MEHEETPSTEPGDLGQFTRQKTILLKTKKRDDTWVAMPVSIVVAHDRAYVRTYDKSWKSKRLRNFPEVGLRPPRSADSRTAKRLAEQGVIVRFEQETDRQAISYALDTMVEQAVPIVREIERFARALTNEPITPSASGPAVRTGAPQQQAQRS
jgi:PPOX class probable F420-dependent enzyme